MSRHKEEPVKKKMLFGGVFPVFMGVWGVVASPAFSQMNLPTDPQAQ